MSDGDDEFKSFMFGVVLTAFFMGWLTYNNMLPLWEGTFEKFDKTYQVKIIAVQKMVPLESAA